MHDHRVRKTLVNLWKLKRIQGIFNEFVNSSYIIGVIMIKFVVVIVA